jgi:type 1 glutamine amidotransferase
MTIPTLLITGANNHDWSRSAPFCQDLLQKSGRFEVTLTDTPAETLSDAVALSRFKLLFVDYNGPAWGATAQQNFTQAVRNGAGVCILHAANNAFTGWREFEEMCALVWREGSAHGSYHRFDIKITDSQHPITRNLPPLLKNHPDELYHRLVHLHHSPYQTLATAYSAPETGGTGRDEPVVVIRSYEKGRIFHCILGHVWPGNVMDTFNNPDFQKLLLRGCEWAGTGQVI